MANDSELINGGNSLAAPPIRSRRSVEKLNMCPSATCIAASPRTPVSAAVSTRRGFGRGSLDCSEGRRVDTAARAAASAAASEDGAVASSSGAASASAACRWSSGLGFGAGIVGATAGPL